MRATLRSGDVRLEPQSALGQRGMRRPSHSFVLRPGPFELAPFCLAPVLAGDTLDSFSLQARIITDAIRNRVAGWWFESWLFYVRLGDLEIADLMRNAVIDPTTPLTGSNRADTPELNKYHHRNANYPSFAYECMQVVARAYFRDEGETWNARQLNGLPQLQVMGQYWWDSIKTVGEVGAGTGADAWAQSWDVYQAMRRAKLTVQTYEEFLAQAGVQVPPQLRELVQDYRIPELISYTRDFAHPVLTTEPSNGTIAANVQWNIATQAKRARAFAEPGFLFGCIGYRPKTYLSRMRTAAADVLLSSAEGWLPAEYETDPHTALKKETGSTVAGAATGPVHNATVDYWWDRRDLFLYGDQWMDMASSFMDTIPAASAGERNLVALPSADLTTRKYVAQTDIDNMFTGTTKAASVDGQISFRIKSRIKSDVTA